MKINDNVADDEWEWYIGQIFSRLIENVCKFKIKNAVEIAPGFRYKIAYALKNINFKGTLYVIDTNKEVLEYVAEKYKAIIPNSKIVCINNNFEHSFADVPNEIDLLLSNHCIDDMIIAEYMQNYYNNNLKNENFKESCHRCFNSACMQSVSCSRKCCKREYSNRQYFKDRIV